MDPKKCKVASLVGVQFDTTATPAPQRVQAPQTRSVSSVGGTVWYLKTGRRGDGETGELAMPFRDRRRQSTTGVNGHCVSMLHGCVRVCVHAVRACVHAAAGVWVGGITEPSNPWENGPK